MKKNITLIITNSLILLLGLCVLCIPDFLKYFNENKFYFDLAEFLNDYPLFRYPVGSGLVIIGGLDLVCSIFQIVEKKNVYVIQKGKNSDFGINDLHFPSCFAKKPEPLVYTNLCSFNETNDAILNLEKNNISNFYSQLKPNTKLSILSVSVFPFLVYSGYCLGEAGRKVDYYHYDRNQAKSKKLRNTHKNTNELIEDERIKGNAKTTICVSVSYDIDKEVVKNEFNGSTIIFLKAKNIGTEVVKNKKDIEIIVDQIRKVIGESAEETNLLLSCPAELCFAIGRKLKSPGLPAIDVYNYSAKSETNKWNWKIKLD